MRPDDPAGGSAETTRRDVLRRGAAVGTAALLGAGVPGAAAAQSAEFGGWFDNVPNYDGVVDRTGQKEVTVEVGVKTSKGPYGFGPAAVRVSPGTTVKWKWTGKGGQHNVVHDGGAFESDLYGDPGVHFSHTFESAGTFKYYCMPHKALGMKGAIVVGGSSGSGGSGGSSSSGGGSGGPSYQPVNYGGWFDNVPNFGGETVDRTGRKEVTVEVGVKTSKGPYGFAPPAIRVSPGTTVKWKWTGKGGQHNVVHQGGEFESDLHGDPGVHFTHTFESSGIYEYYCMPHKALGMKGAVVVGDVSQGGGSAGSGKPAEEPEPAWSPPGGDFGITFFGLLYGVAGLGALAVLGAEQWSRFRSRNAAAEATTEATAAEGASADVATEATIEQPARTVEHDEYDPRGTATLVFLYLLIIAGMWVLMYFVEFLGGPTVIG